MRDTEALPTTTVRLLYVPTTPPRRHPSTSARYELTCDPRSTQWSVRAPGEFTARGEVFVPEPEFLHAWLGEVIARFDGVAGDGEYLLPSNERFLAFLEWLEPMRATNDDEDLARLIELFPGDVDLLLARAARPGRLAHEVEHDVAAALAVRSDPVTLLAASYVFSPRDRPRAIELLQRALQQDEQNQDVLSALLTLCELDGRYQESLAIEERLAARRPRGPSEWIRRARIFEQLGRSEEELEAVTQSLSLRDEPMWRVRRGKLLARLGRDDEALRELDLALPRCADFDGHLLRAELLAKKGELEAAEKTLRWVALAPSHRAIAEERLRQLKVF